MDDVPHAYDRADIGPIDFLVEVMRDKTENMYHRMQAARHLHEAISEKPMSNIFDQMKLTREDIECLARTIQRWQHENIVNRRDFNHMQVKGHS
jgi:hypothetical protein